MDLVLEESQYQPVSPKNKKKQKAPTNKERFESLEQQIVGLTAALTRLTTIHESPPHLASPVPAPTHNDSGRAPPHLSRASTPKHRTSVRRALITNLPEPNCTASLLADPILPNAVLLNDEKAKKQADILARPLADTGFPRTGGKTTFDTYLNKPVAYEMPRHFVGLHSQRRIRALDSHDDLLLSEFLQGYITMVLRSGIDNVVAQAMVQCLGMLGEALVDYQWCDIRDWINAILHEVGQGRIEWRDQKYIADQLNAAKLRASMNHHDDPQIPICSQYNQGRCRHQNAHGAYKHICVACYLLTGAHHAHPLTTCRRKNGNHTPGCGNYRDNNNQNSAQYQSNNSHTGQNRPYHNGGNRDRRSHDNGYDQGGDSHQSKN